MKAGTVEGRGSLQLGEEWVKSGGWKEWIMDCWIALTGGGWDEFLVD
jgi:hypothetical protein